MLIDRSSPVLLRFSKQLKLGLSDSTSSSVSRPAGALAGADNSGRSIVLTSSVASCQEHLCLTESLTQQLCHASQPLLQPTAASQPSLQLTAALQPSLQVTAASQLSLKPTAASQPSLQPTAASQPSLQPTAASQLSHSQRFDKNIFTRICLGEKTSDELMKTESVADKTMLLDCAENESLLQSNRCPVSSSFTVTGQNLENPAVISTCSTSVAAVASDVMKAGHSEQNWSTDDTERLDVNDVVSYASAAKSTSSNPETENLLHIDYNASDSACVSLLDPTVAGSVMEQRIVHVASVFSVDSEACRSSCDRHWTKAGEKIYLKEKQADDDDDAGKNSSANVVPSLSNCSDSVSQCIGSLVSKSDTSVKEPLMPTCSVSVVASVEEPLVSTSDECSSVPVIDHHTSAISDSAVNGANSDDFLPSVSNIETSESFVDYDCLAVDSSSVSSRSSGCASDAVDNVQSVSQMSEEHPHQLQSCASVTAYGEKLLSAISCTSATCFPSPVTADNLPQRQLQTAAEMSHPVPVSLFCAQSSTVPAPVPVALFCTRSYSSTVSLSATENSPVVSQHVPPGLCSSSGGAVHSGLLAVSVSLSASEIPGTTVQRNLTMLRASVEGNTEKDGNVSDHPVSCVVSSGNTVWSTALLLSSNPAASNVSPINSCSSDSLSQSSNMSISTLPISSPPLEDPQQCSTSSEVTGDGILNSQQFPVTNGHGIDGLVEERKDPSISNGDVSSENISDLQLSAITNLVDVDCHIDEKNDLNDLENNISDLPRLPITNDLETQCRTEEQKDFDISNSDVPDGNDSYSDQLPASYRLEVDCQVQEQKYISISNSDEPNDCISDELIVSQILEADSSQSESLDHLFMSHSSASDCCEYQKWREMVSPIISSYQLSKTSEENSDSSSLCDVVSAKEANSNSQVNDAADELILPTELNVSHQSPHADIGFLSSVVSGSDDWMYDSREVQDVLCSLLKSCHVNSTDDDVSLPLGDDDDDEAHSCCSSSTEVYVDFPGDAKLNDVSSRCASPRVTDSDGTVSPLSVVLDGDGLDLMDSASDGFRNIYSSLVDPTQMDSMLCSDANVLSNVTCCNKTSTDSQPTNLSAFSVDDSVTDRSRVASLLDKECCPAVMALDAALVKNLPCPTASVSSLCDRLEECKQWANEDKASVQTDDGDKTVMPVSCHCSQLHVSKKSCRSSLRMPEKLADIDPTSPSLACRPPPLSSGCGKYVTNAGHALDTAEGDECTASSSANAVSQVVSIEKPSHVHGRKRKLSSVSDVESKANVDLSSSADEAESCGKGFRETMLTHGTFSKRENKNSKAVANADNVTSKNFSNSSATETESCTLRICCASRTKISASDAHLLRTRLTSSEESGAACSVHSSQAERQTVFTLEQTRSHSTRTIILRKPAFPPMLSKDKKCKSKWKLNQLKVQQNVNYSLRRGEVQHEEKEKEPFNTVGECRWTSDDDDNAHKGRNKDVSEVEDGTSEYVSLKKKNKKKVKNDENAGERYSLRRVAAVQSVSHSSEKVSQDNGSRCNKSDNGTHRSVLDRDSNRIHACRGRPRKRCSPLDQLVNSERYNKSDNGSHRSVLERDSSRVNGRRGRPKKRCSPLSQLTNSEGSDRSNNSTDRSVLDRESGRSGVSRSRPRKRCSLLAQLANSEGYVADRNVMQQDDADSLLWSDASSLSREQRALQVSTGAVLFLFV